MGIVLELTAERALEICSAARVVLEKQYAERKAKTLAEKTKQIIASSGFLWWRKIFATPIPQHEAEEMALHWYDNPGDAFFPPKWEDAFTYNMNIESLSSIESAAKLNCNQTIKFTGGTAHTILYFQHLANANA